MSSTARKSPPPDQAQRQQALDPTRSILVQAPAGSGKTDLLTRRFLKLLSTVDEPGQIVAITFTKAAAAEMRHRILDELEKASQSGDSVIPVDEFSMEALAHRALAHSNALGWNLLDLPAQLRISTIDSFCRDLAVQQPLLSGLGGGLDIAEQPDVLYRRAARQTLRKIDEADPTLSGAIAALLEWRDNNWQEMEDLLVKMLAQRDRWMHDFLFTREWAWDELRERLERPFANAIREALTRLSDLFDKVPPARQQALELARFACAQSDGQLHRELAELVEFPVASLTSGEQLEEARQAYLNLGELLLINTGTFRKQITVRNGFPPEHKREKTRILDLIAALSAIPGLEETLASVRNLPPARYTEEDWEIVRACFALLRHAAAQLRTVFAEAGAVDFTEVAQIARSVVRADDGFPTDAALAVADGIRHLLVDEFQDTSRRQYELLASLIAAWDDRSHRTCFAVGDPMQSIYFFREADAELFPRVRDNGLELPNDEPLRFDSVGLKTNFRTVAPLIERLNEIFTQVFAVNDGSGVTFSSSEAPSEPKTSPGPPFTLHLEFVPKNVHGGATDPAIARRFEDAALQRESAQKAQVEEIADLIRGFGSRMEQGRGAFEQERGAPFRIAVLGRAKKHLVPIAAALRKARIPFRAVELEELSARPEILDALALARALMNPQDRVAWLGVLRAPWCGLSLADLHTIAGDLQQRDRPVPELLAERLNLLSEAGRPAAARVLKAIDAAQKLRSANPTASLGTRLEQSWLLLGGDGCVDPTARANLDLLWSCLDRLPGGEQDLFGPALKAALERLTALPDPDAGGECGVQLMTIHKSKGLEFEVVIVPELQARSGGDKRNMLSWLERGLAEPGDSGEITEFLIAPFQIRGGDASPAKAWVDRVYCERESQEMRRVLYVAATRAREELHLFARPEFKQEKDGSISLIAPSDSLLATAWPGLEEDVRARFAAWQPAPVQAEIAAIAAGAESNVLVMPSPARATLLRRLPPDFDPDRSESLRAPSLSHPERSAAESKDLLLGTSGESVGNQEPQTPVHLAEPALSLFPRHEGGLPSRALGTAVHTLLEELARLRAKMDWTAARAALQRLEPRIAADARAAGIDPSQARQIAAKALQHALAASHDPIGAWILSPHPASSSEARWAGVLAGALRTVRVDRVFKAGATPGSEGEDCWWIVDYKTAFAGGPNPAAELPGLRKQFAPQVEAYSQVLRNLHGSAAPVRAALYYPRMLLLDWWEL